MIVGRVVTATIALTCVLIVYDGWTDLRLRDAIYAIVAPVLAIVITHVFSASVALEVELGRRPTRREWITKVRFESGFLLLALPPVAILIILKLAGVSLNDSIRVIIWVEALSLSLWAGLAAHRAGLRGRSLAMAVVAGLVVSGIVLALLVILEPGKPVQNGAPPPPQRSSTDRSVAKDRLPQLGWPRCRMVHGPVAAREVRLVAHLPDAGRSPRSRRPLGVGDVAGERGDRAASMREYLDLD